ncbi:LysR family transcriptional regulator [Steroidobacter sp. S1-65]|uniref:LysR family transcriptional regulator n=1 Tax=Steroidobacter gossypii TaxID=2805490 RepID=A0ABS1WSN4_9GAMM|nr:LysR family transcriptional regulator [Steroidobacter gossypii]MBM0103989.1 LysR family transcriptional regulator [Steroidobacter gossypii]
MDKFTCMLALTKVVELGSFAEAARHMKVSAPMVTKYIIHLEEILGSRLLNRSTHSLSLTDVGQLYHQRCVQILEDIGEAEAVAGANSAVPRGALKICVSGAFDLSHVGPVLLEYFERHTDVRLEVTESNHLLDLVEEGFDVAVCACREHRTGNHARNNNLARKRLAISRIVACAAPAYLEKNPQPTIPDDLLHHNCLVFGDSAPTSQKKWRFARDGGDFPVQALGTLRATSNELLKQAALRGQGIILQPTFNVHQELKSGALRQVLADYDAGSLGIYLIHPERRHLATKVRAFMELVEGRWGTNPDVDSFWPDG